MRVRAAIPAAALLATLLGGCSNAHTSAPAAPTTSPAVPVKATPTQAQLIAKCVTAIEAGLDKGDGAPDCTALSPDDYLTALHKANQAGRSTLEKELQSATANPQ